MNDVVVVAAVLLLVASGYAAGRVHAEVGYRTGFRFGYRQGHADASRRAAAPAGPDPDDMDLRVIGEAASSEVRQYDVIGGLIVHRARHARG